MLDLLIAFGLPLLLRIGIGDIIALSGLAKGLVGKIGEKDALKIQKKAIDETIKKSGDDEAKVLLENLKKNEKIVLELRKLDVSEEGKKSLVSQYFRGREDVFEDLAKNYFDNVILALILIKMFPGHCDNLIIIQEISLFNQSELVAEKSFELVGIPLFIVQRT